MRMTRECCSAGRKVLLLGAVLLASACGSDDSEGGPKLQPTGASCSYSSECSSGMCDQNSCIDAHSQDLYDSCGAPEACAAPATKCAFTPWYDYVTICTLACTTDAECAPGMCAATGVCAPTCTPGNLALPLVCAEGRWMDHVPWTSDDRRLFPIEQGRVWYYSDGAVMKTEILAEPLHRLNQSWEATWTDGDEVVYLDVQSDDPDRIWGLYDEYISCHMLTTPAEGETWSMCDRWWTWRHLGPVTVPAGTFEDCWQAEIPTSDGTGLSYLQIWCPGVGRVVNEYLLLPDNRQELIGTNFIPWAAPPPQ